MDPLLTVVPLIVATITVLTVRKTVRGSQGLALRAGREMKRLLTRQETGPQSLISQIYMDKDQDKADNIMLSSFRYLLNSG